MNFCGTTFWILFGRSKCDQIVLQQAINAGMEYISMRQEQQTPHNGSIHYCGLCDMDSDTSVAYDDLQSIVYYVDGLYYCPEELHYDYNWSHSRIDNKTNNKKFKQAGSVLSTAQYMAKKKPKKKRKSRSTKSSKRSISSPEETSPEEETSHEKTPQEETSPEQSTSPDESSAIPDPEEELPFTLQREISRRSIRRPEPARQPSDPDIISEISNRAIASDTNTVYTIKNKYIVWLIVGIMCIVLVVMSIYLGFRMSCGLASVFKRSRESPDSSTEGHLPFCTLSHRDAIHPDKTSTTLTRVMNELFDPGQVTDAFILNNTGHLFATTRDLERPLTLSDTNTLWKLITSSHSGNKHKVVFLGKIFTFYKCPRCPDSLLVGKSSSTMLFGLKDDSKTLVVLTDVDYITPVIETVRELLQHITID